MELANEGIPEEFFREFKKVGSNFQIKDRTVLFEPRGAWKTLLDSGFGGGNALVSRLRHDPISALKCDFDFWRWRRDSNSRWIAPHHSLTSAETARFELARGFPLLAFQASALDRYATSPHW